MSARTLGSSAAWAGIALIYDLLASDAWAQSKCDGARLAAASQLATRSLQCHSLAVRKGLAVDPACIARAQAKFATRYAKAARPGDCVATALTDVTLAAAVVDATDVFATEQRPDPMANKCAAFKLARLGAASAQRLRCESKAARKGEAVDPACAALAASKLAAAFARAEAEKAPCLTVGDAADVTAAVDVVAGGITDLVQNQPTPTWTISFTPTKTPTHTFTPAPPTATFSATPTPMPATPTISATPLIACGASAPACGGTCPVARFCEADGGGGCHCVAIAGP